MSARDGTEPDMGVTSNAILLLGYIAGAMLSRRDGATYPLRDARPDAGELILEHIVSGNTYRVSVVQLTGVE